MRDVVSKEDYEARTMRDLTELARNRGIEVVKGMSKADLIGILRDSDGPGSP